MGKVRKIALVTCASNFERHKNIVQAVHEKFVSMGDYALYVFTNYGVFGEGMDFSHGEPAIYSLLEDFEPDGCILESNLGSIDLTERIVNTMRERKVPMMTINMEAPDIPHLHLNVAPACEELMEHLINDHGCTRINLVLSEGNDVVSQETLAVYRSVMEKYNIPINENRIVELKVSSHNGEKLCQMFEEAGVMDARAVLCVHDVNAISLILGLKNRGIRVPEDVIVCSMNHSGNSIAFRPGITGVDRLDRYAASLACELLEQQMDGKSIPIKNTYEGVVRYHGSCGCNLLDLDKAGSSPEYYANVYRQIVLNKIEAGGQIGGMLRFSGLLESTDSLEQLAIGIDNMITGLGCQNFFCCLNEGDIPYIESNAMNDKDASEPPYEKNMVVVAGNSKRTGRMHFETFEKRSIVPFEPQKDDMIMLLPIHYMKRDYGYMAFLNEDMPVNTYNYRICNESIGSNIENLHRHIVLKSTAAELDRLYMQDQMTGLFNRFALSRFSYSYVSDAGYSVAVLDLDGLKKINDTHGHLAGNFAISTSANVIKECFGEDCIPIRYGGDEFLILSHRTDADFWEAKKVEINERLQKIVEEKNLPYNIGLSVGYSICNKDCFIQLDACIETADKAMYEDKAKRKALRTN